MTDETPAHGCTINGQPAMPILISEYNQLVAENNRLTAELGDYEHLDAALGRIRDRKEATEARVRQVAAQIRAGAPWAANLDNIADRIEDALADEPAPAPAADGPVLYRHYKGGLYTVTGTATHTSSGERLVVYRDTEGGMWARPEAEFTGMVDGRPRFTRVDPAATQATDTTKEN